MNADAKIYCMIEDLSRGALLELLDNPCEATNSGEFTADSSHSYLQSVVRQQYETGEIPAEEIVAAWNDDTWNGKD